MKYGLYDEAENIWIGNEPHWSEAMKDQPNDKRANAWRPVLRNKSVRCRISELPSNA